MTRASASTGTTGAPPRRCCATLRRLGAAARARRQGAARPVRRRPSRRARRLRRAARTLRFGEKWSEAHGGEALARTVRRMGRGRRARLRLLASPITPRCSTRSSPASARRSARKAHPRLQILGLLEARLLSFDLALLAGLDETIWPPAAETDAFLNRPMRAALGLSRRSGASARPRTTSSPRSARPRRSSAARRNAAARRRSPRDFCSAWARSPAKRRSALAEARGQALYRPRARARPPASAIAPTPRPAPRPPRALRPEPSQRHPHRDAAARPLRGLRRVDPAPEAAGADRRRDGAARDRRRLARGAARVLRSACPRDPCPPTRARGSSPSRARASRRCSPIPRSAPCAGRASSAASTRFSPSTPSGAPLAERILVEQGGRLEIPLADGSTFTLTARADRIEILRGGGAALIDYKSGSPPGIERGRGRLRAATDPRSGDAVARRLRRPGPASRRSRRSISSSAAPSGGEARELEVRRRELRRGRRARTSPA